jgi:hypothetical protein
MTDQLSDVVVTGQRRPAGSTSPFPTFPASLFVPARYLNPEATRGETAEIDPCSYVPFRKNWDSDAAALEGSGRILDRAAELGYVGPYGAELAQREYLIPLREVSGGGVELGELATGWTLEENPEQFPGVQPDWTGVTASNIRGFIHNHPASAGNIQPSGADLAIMNGWVAEMTALGRLASDFTIYIIAQELVNGQLQNKVYAFKPGKTNLEDAEEVNPNAQTCANS